jgi:hypothetical protein
VRDGDTFSSVYRHGQQVRQADRSDAMTPQVAATPDWISGARTAATPGCGAQRPLGNREILVIDLDRVLAIASSLI